MRKHRKSEIGEDGESIMASYLRDIRRIPLLSREDEEEIARQAASGNKAARERLISSNLRFVVKIAKKYQGRGLPLSDLISEGNIGLIKAIDHFEVERGYNFISYDVWWIRQTMLIAIAEKARIIRMPMQWNATLKQIEITRQYMQDEKLNYNDIKDIAERLQLDTDRVRELVMLGQDVISLQQPIDKNNSASLVCDFLECDINISPEEHTLKTMLKKDIDKVLSVLTEKEAQVLKARFGLGDGIPKSLQEIGDTFKMSKEGIRQIESKAIKRLKESGQAEILEAYVA